MNLDGDSYNSISLTTHFRVVSFDFIDEFSCIIMSWSLHTVFYCPAILCNILPKTSLRAPSSTLTLLTVRTLELLFKCRSF